tara:strand:+ start:748 stop:999 length:252 start_codon:yes stop_codon:yes gene_type:complete
MKTKNVLLEQLKGEREFNSKMNMTDGQINDLVQDVEDELSKMDRERATENAKLNEIKFLLEEFELGGIDIFELIKRINNLINS